MSFESGVSNSVEVSEDVDKYEDNSTRLLVRVFGGRVLWGLGRKAGCEPTHLYGLFAWRGRGVEAGLQEVRYLSSGASVAKIFPVW